jgi:hypothetical protein
MLLPGRRWATIDLRPPCLYFLLWLLILRLNGLLITFDLLQLGLGRFDECGYMAFKKIYMKMSSRLKDLNVLNV